MGVLFPLIYWFSFFLAYIFSISSTILLFLFHFDLYYHLFMKKIVFLFLCLLSLYGLMAQEIRINQIGFYPNEPKLAVVSASAENSFQLIDPSGKVVYTGVLGAAKEWAYAGEMVRLADFSGFKTTGSYRVKVGALQSHPFDIQAHIHQQVTKAALKAFYYNRASMELLPAYASTWARKAGHSDTKVLVHTSAASPQRPAGTVISCSKGWYDAGDYNKYIVNSAISVYTMMALYEDFPAYTKILKTDIPESSNSTPDLLDEIRWNLDWMLTMQDPADGGVYHKLTELKFSDFAMPEKVTHPRYVVMKTTAAALDLAAVMAVASRVYKPFDAKFSATCLKAALQAWKWAKGHPAVYYMQPKDVETGQYEDNSVTDEWAWAANELYITTKDEAYNTATPFLKLPADIPNWSSVNTLGLISLVHHRKHLTAKADTAAIKQKLLTLADQQLAATQSSAYRVGITKFEWGSNSTVANIGFVLMQAYQLTQKRVYLEATIAQLDYLLGKNATGYSFVTGHGDHTPKDIHHRPSGADSIAEPVPGFLVGGPQPGQQDKCTYPSNLPARSYLDAVCSYSTNEIAINWNAPLVYLLGAVEASVK